MMKRAIILLVAFCSLLSAGATDSVRSFRLHSRAVNDDYEIRLRLPRGFDSSQRYAVLYAPDGNIGSGRYLIEKAPRPDSLIIVTIGHTGNWHRQRNRDFIPSDASGRQPNEFAAHRFLEFLKTELLPEVHALVPHQSQRVLVGHSLSGLFCLYTALVDPELFDRYEAISPSVWANRLELLKIEKSMTRTDLPTTVHIYAGGLEVFNRVLSSTKKFRRQIRARNYPGLTLTYRKFNVHNHFSVRWPALKSIIRSF